MPNCELCGATADELNRTEISSAELSVCSNCTGHGTAVEDDNTGSETETKYDTSVSESQTSSPGNSVEKSATTEGYEDFSDLALNYGDLIQNARNSRGMNRDELARELGIKASHLKNIEDETTQPDVELQRQIERELDVDLLMEDADYE